MTQMIKRKWYIDDSLDVFPVHGVGGILGTLMAGIFSSTELGVFSGHGFADGINSIGEQFYVQLVGVVATFVYTAVVSLVLLLIIKSFMPVRVSKEDEISGLDIVAHDERGYDL